MKKFFLLTMASMMTVFVMAIGRNDGSTKANSIDFDWNTGVEHTGGTKWYRVSLDPLKEVDNPTLTLYLTNPSNEVGTSVDVSMKATVAGQVETKDYTIGARQYKTYTANASVLIRMKQEEIYLTLTSNGRIKLSAKVFESEDLDETCRDAETLRWYTATEQKPMYSKWWRISLTDIKDTTKMHKDARVTITNTGTKTVNLKVGQSLDCPSSGMTKRTYELAPGEAVIDTIPQSMIMGVQPNELYFGIENVESKISILVDTVAQPVVPIIPATAPFVDLHVTDTLTPLPTGETYYRIKVSEMNSLAKYEPEFTYRNVGATNAKVTIKMAFEVPALGTSNTTYDLASGEEEIVVYKKNMLEGMENEVEYIYLLTIVEGDVNFYGRFKHIREGKACKTNIDFNWETGHVQEARTTQWYAIEVAAARDSLKDLVVNVENQSSYAATLKASLAFSCPYIDLEEVTRTISANSTTSRRIGYSSYSMMSDTIWIGLETSQQIHFWVDTVDAPRKAEADTICKNAIDFDWDEGVVQHAGDTVWYRINMDSARARTAKFPTVFIQNMSSTKAAKITAELSVECPDSIENQTRTLTIEANGSYSKKLSSNLFENIIQPEVYLRVITTQDVALQVILTEKPAGSDCENAITFNWTSGNKQEANASLWYMVDLSDALTNKEDVLFKVENKDNTETEFIWKIAKECNESVVPSIERFQVGARGIKTILKQYASLRDLKDSIIYVGLEGTTSLYLSAERTPIAPVDTIDQEGLDIQPISIANGQTYVPAESVEWKQLTTEDINAIREAKITDPKTLALHFTNTSAEDVEVLFEIAYEFPVTDVMLQLRYTVPAGSTLDKTLNWEEFNEKVGANDSIYVRVTIPGTAVGSISYSSTLVDAFDGATREEAVPIVMNKRYEQPAMSERWYKVNTADLKKDKNLYNKILNVASKNIGNGSASINVMAYDGLLATEDLLYGYLDPEQGRSRSIKKGQGKSHNIPAQAIYALGNVELYIWVRTTEKIMFETKFNGEYAEITPDPEQQNATLVVPNVDYILPANETKWFRVCAPYILNNYKYVDAANLEYELQGNEPATVEITATLQDTMTYNMPVRTRTINKSGKARQGQHTLRYLLDKAIKHFDEDFGVPTLPEQDIDSILRRFITSDSITGYIRVRCSREVRLRLNMPQITGDECSNAMEFDWEHGNVNPADQKTWYHVRLADQERVSKDSVTIYPYIPKDCDLRLYVDNWDLADSTSTSAKIYFDCNDPVTKSGTYKIAAQMGDSIDVDRDLLEKLGWADMIIDYHSDKVTHIWAKLIPDVPRDSVLDTVNVYVCAGDTYIDSIRGANNYKEFPNVQEFRTWRDTVPFQDGVVMKDSITLFFLHPVFMPQAISSDSIQALGATPLLVQGMQLFVDSSTVRLTQAYRDYSNAHDTIARIDTVYWGTPVYDGVGALRTDTAGELNLTKFYEKTDLQEDLMLVIEPDSCGQPLYTKYTFALGDYLTEDTSIVVCPAEIPDENPKTDKVQIMYDTLGTNLARYMDTIVTYVAKDEPGMYDETQVLNKPVANEGESIANADATIQSLLAQFDEDADENTMAVESAKWQVKVNNEWQDLTAAYKVPAGAQTITMRYVITTECTTAKESDELTIEVIPAPTPTCLPTTGEDEYMTMAFGEDSVWNDIDLSIYPIGLNEVPYVTTNACGSDSTITLFLTVTKIAKLDSTVTLTICDGETEDFHGQTYPGGPDEISATGEIRDTLYHITVNTLQKATYEFDYADCDKTYQWEEHTCDHSDDYVHVYAKAAANGCDSVVTMHFTLKEPTKLEPEVKHDECNLYKWRNFEEPFYEDGLYYDTVYDAQGCPETIYTLDLTLQHPYKLDLPMVSKYNDRLLMINRNEINLLDDWDLDIDNDTSLVKWYYRTSLTAEKEFLHTGYYHTINYHGSNPSEKYLKAGFYHAEIEIPAAKGNCGLQGTTPEYEVVAHTNNMPVLVPTLAQPGEDIRVLNLDPEQETRIRIYTSEGMIQGTYTVRGEESYTIKAASEHGFYLVEVISEGDKSTLRYIVK